MRSARFGLLATVFGLVLSYVQLTQSATVASGPNDAGSYPCYICESAYSTCLSTCLYDPDPTACAKKCEDEKNECYKDCY
jgi:hypothetical protein